MVIRRPNRYSTLCCGTASTIPKRKSLREPWMTPFSPTEESQDSNPWQGELCGVTGKVKEVRQHFDDKKTILNSSTLPRKREPCPIEKPVREISYRPVRRKYNTIVPHRITSWNGAYEKCTGNPSERPKSVALVTVTDYDGNEVISSVNSSSFNEKRRLKLTKNRRHTAYSDSSIWSAVQKYELEMKKDQYETWSSIYDRNIPSNTTNDKNPNSFPNDDDRRGIVDNDDHVVATTQQLNGLERPSRERNFSSRLEVLERRRDTDEQTASKVDDVTRVQNAKNGSIRPSYDANDMCDISHSKLSKVPRIVGACVKSYRDIPAELFNSLPESSVDPSSEDDVQNCSRNSEWSNMREGRRCLWSYDDRNFSDSEIDVIDASKPDEYLPRELNSRDHYRPILSGSPHPAPTLISSSEFPPRQPSPEEPAATVREIYLSDLDRDLQNAGVYFRRPQQRGASRSAYVSVAEGSEEVNVALATLDASLEGFTSDDASSSCGESPTSLTEKSRISSVSDKAPGKYDVVTRADGRLPSITKHREPRRFDATMRDFKGEGGAARKGTKMVIEVRPYSDRAIAIRDDEKPNVENLNLIEEVYVTSRTKSVPVSSVQMRAYYPRVNYGKDSSSPPQQQVFDNDSGHESGATSPCETLAIVEDTSSPPPSPSVQKLSQLNLNYESHLRKLVVKRSNSPNLESSVNSSKVVENSGQISDTDCLGGAVTKGRIEDEFRHRLQVDANVESSHIVVVAIDFGTTYSGYAFSFTNDAENIHIMKKWEGGDPGIQNQKTPTIVLLTPDEEFHSLGFEARDTYHDLDPLESQKWLYFDKFKMELHSNQTLTCDTLLEATNGKKIRALKIFSCALRYFRDHALRELFEQMGVELSAEDVRWVITVPAIWSHPAKQFMRTAAYQAGMGSKSHPDQLLIALEPEAAAIYCRRLKQHQLVQEKPPLELRIDRLSDTYSGSSLRVKSLSKEQETGDNVGLHLPALNRDTYICYFNQKKVHNWLEEGTVYMVVDCGGGTVDITVHQMTDRKSGHLKELHKATGGPYGSIGVDREFEKLLDTVFGGQFMTMFRIQRSAAYVELMIAFEARKRNASPYKSSPLNISLPFAFIDFYKKMKGKEVESTIKKHSQALGIRWSSQGMLRIEQETMRKLFSNTLQKITESIDAVLSAPEVGKLQYMFLVGGFSESELLQKHIRDQFGSLVNVIIPQGMGLAILQGAVKFGQDPSVVTVRRSRLTLGVGVLNSFEKGIHPDDKKVLAAGSTWCADILDKFVEIDESVAVGDIVTRSYTPATPSQKSVILHLYATSRHDVKYVTEPDVKKVGTLHLLLGELLQESPKEDKNEEKKLRREITVHLKFGETEIKASAVDHVTGQCVKVNIELLKAI